MDEVMTKPIYAPDMKSLFEKYDLIDDEIYWKKRNNYYKIDL